MWCQRKGGLSAITQVKVSSPEMHNIAQDQGFHDLEVSTAACANGEYVSNVPGSEAMVGNRIVCVGTWESQCVSKEVVNKRERQEDDTAHW